MKLRRHLWVFVMLVLPACVFFLRKTNPVPEATVTPSPTPSSPPAEPIVPTAPAGDEILHNYRAPNGTVKEDLRQVHTVIDNFQLLAKVEGALPLGSNEEIVQALTGTNPVKLRFLSPDHPAINADGQLVDRWDTPLFFHAVSRDRIEIRSAGPDRVLWTDDDINRHPNGQFVEGPGTADYGDCASPRIGAM